MDAGRISRITIRKGFTMVELIVIVALLGLLVVVISPRLSWMEPPKRVLQRALLEAVEISRTGASVRFRVENSQIVPEILLKGEGNTREGEWALLKMENPPLGDAWKFEPEIAYFFPDGTSSPAKLTYGTPPEAEIFLLTVTGYLVEAK